MTLVNSTEAERDIHTTGVRIAFMDKNQIIAIVFAILMVTSMVVWGASFIF